MTSDNLSVRELEPSDIELISAYWLKSDKAFLESMGVDLAKLPTEEQFANYLTIQMNTPIPQKESYCIIWLENNIPIGHSNTRPTTFGKEAFMHLHLWNKETRRKGMGTELVKLTLPYFFGNLEIKDLYSEPYALNPAPNKTLQKAGFDLMAEHITTPGAFNFEQPVKRWHLSREKFENLKAGKLGNGEMGEWVEGK